jgi:superfamily II DNA or RNA helicase
LLVIKKVNSQKYTIAPAGGLRDEVLKKLVWDHAKHQSGYLFTDAYRSGRWNGKVQVYRPTNIRAGYIQETIDYLDNNGVEWQWEGNVVPENTPVEMSEPEFTYEEFYKFCTNLIEAVKPSFAKKHNIDLEVRDYQIEAAWKFLTCRIGIALHATSAGKSLTIAFILGFLFYKNIIKKAVILVPLQSLVTQFYGDLMDFGFKKRFVGKLYSGVKQTNRPITVAINPSTHNMIGTVAETEFFDRVDLVICDEVHKASAKTVTESVLRFHNAQYFFGCTGTLPEDPLDKEIVHSLFGNVLDKRKLKELREEYNAVSNVKVGILNFCYGMKGLMSRAKSRESTMDWQEEVHFLQNDFDFRNPYIINTLINNFKRGKKIVALVKNIEYGLKMYHQIEENIDRKSRKVVYWIDGSMKLADRDAIIKKCKNSKSPYIIVTNFQIFSTGVNIQNINMVAMVDAGKSKITVAQTIGRGVRKAKNKSEVLVLDCSCDLKYGNRHGRKRKKLYAEEGFTVMEKVVYRDEDAKLKEKFDALR